MGNTFLVLFSLLLLLGRWDLWGTRRVIHKSTGRSLGPDEPLALARCDRAGWGRRRPARAVLLLEEADWLALQRGADIDTWPRT